MKDLLTQQAGETSIVVSLAEYKHDLAVKLWRENKHDKARPLLHEAIEGAENVEKRLGYTNTLSIIEQSAERFDEAIQLIRDALPVAEELADEYRLAKLHMTQGNNFRCLADAINSNEPREHALIHFAGAAHFFEKIGDRRHVAMVKNNLADVLLSLGSVDDAMGHIDNAIAIIESLRDTTDEDRIMLLQALETRAKVNLAAKRTRAAVGDALRSAQGLHEAEEWEFLKPSLETLRLALERQDYEEESDFLGGALDARGGHVKRAADLVGMNHGSFSRLLNKHPELQHKRRAKLKPRGRNRKREQVSVS